jgi:hypothetical protein
MPYVRALVPFRDLLMPGLLAAAGLAFLLIWSQPKPSSPLFNSHCDGSDAEASAVIALLVADRSDMARALASDALFRLKRARTYCRHGFVGLAKADYDALLSKRFEIRQ